MSYYIEACLLWSPYILRDLFSPYLKSVFVRNGQFSQIQSHIETFQMAGNSDEWPLHIRADDLMPCIAVASRSFMFLDVQTFTERRTFCGHACSRKFNQRILLTIEISNEQRKFPANFLLYTHTNNSHLGIKIPGMRLCSKWRHYIHIATA